MSLTTQPGYQGVVGYRMAIIDLNGDPGFAIVPGFIAVAPTIIADGIAVSVGAASTTAALPNNSLGLTPTSVRLASTQAMYVRLNGGSEATAAVSAPGTFYIPGDTITLTGGTFNSAAVLTVDTAQLISASPNARGTGYVPADTITLAGGTINTAAVVTVATTRVVSATIAAAGTGGTPGAATVTGTTGTGTKLQAAVTISAGGVITSVNSISVAGSYTVNPADISAEPVTGASLSGATLTVVMGVNTITVSTPGDYSATSASLTQGATSGVGVGATFNTARYGVLTASVTDAGDYSVNPSNPVAQGSTSGSGTSATFTMAWGSAAVAGDILLYPGAPLFLDTAGYDQISAIRLSADGILQISPVEG